MLVLSRRRGEAVVIGDGILVQVIEIRGDKVRLGVEAPAEVPVHRREVYEAILRHASTLEASMPASSSPPASSPPAPTIHG